VLKLNHYSVRTADVEATRAFYVDVLGLVVGPRPAFPFPGVWLYAGDTASTDNAVVHVIGVDPVDASGLQGYLGGRDGATGGSGALDHVAFSATGLAAMRARLAELGLAPRERTVPGLGLHQLFVVDPNGIVVELNFPAAEAGA
jgi:catechol 2,3-dioxygenase-like lactoylglutathione lyase family enzyme